MGRFRRLVFLRLMMVLVAVPIWLMGETADARPHRNRHAHPASAPSIDHYFYGNPAHSHADAAPTATAASATPVAAASPSAGAAATPARIATPPPVDAPTAVATTTSPAAAGTPSVPAVAMTAPRQAISLPTVPSEAPAPSTADAVASHSIDHFFYGQPAGVRQVVVTPFAAAPTATPAPAVPGAAPAALAAIIPPSPPVQAIPARATVGAASASPSPERIGDGLRLYLADSAAARLNPFHWSIRATKSLHQLQVFYRGGLFQSYHAVFGRSLSDGPKRWEGDRRTPEGAYLILSKHRSARFRWFLKINYPNAIDQAAFLHLAADGDIPRGLREGGSVGIHGTDQPVLNLGNIDWTTGCISIDNDAISELARLLPIGTLVVIKP